MGIPRAVRPEDDEDYTLQTPTDYEIRKIAMECASRMMRLKFSSAMTLNFIGTEFQRDMSKFKDVVSELESYLKESMKNKSLNHDAL